MKLPIAEIKINPKNPRIIKDDKFKKLVQSVTDFPEMADVRPIVVNKDHVVLGGNMRFKAMKEAGWKEVPVTVVDWSQDKQDEFVIKDNVSGGEWDWDLLANEWDIEQIDSWGLDLPSFISVDGVVDHFREADGDKLESKDDYEGKNSNTLILIFNDSDYMDMIEKLKTLMAKDYGNTPSEIIHKLVRDASI